MTALLCPAKDGSVADIVLGYDSLQDYLDDPWYFGAIVGRYCNRIANGSFTLNDKVYSLTKNDGPNFLHGGRNGFSRQVMDASPIPRIEHEPDSVALALRLFSPDGEEGFPGNVHFSVIYTLSQYGELRIRYQATTDLDTVINLTNHSYFNLSGHASGTILDHVLEIRSHSYLPTNPQWIPTGAVSGVDRTPFDFRTPHAIGGRIPSDHPDLKIGEGYNQNYVVGAQTLLEPKLIARVSDPKSGRVLETWTTEPGVQLYTLNQLAAPIPGKCGALYPEHGAFCLETQHFPDSPNQPSFPSTLLRAGDVYRSTTIYKLSTTD